MRSVTINDTALFLKIFGPIFAAMVFYCWLFDNSKKDKKIDDSDPTYPGTSAYAAREQSEQQERWDEDDRRREEYASRDDDSWSDSYWNDNRWSEDRWDSR